MNHHGRGGRQFYRGGGTSAAMTRNLDDLSRSFQGQKTDIDEMRNIISRFTKEIDQLKIRVEELESSSSTTTNKLPATTSNNFNNKRNGHHQSQQGGDSLSANNQAQDQELSERDKRKKMKILKQREKKAAKVAERRASRAAAVVGSRIPTDLSQPNTNTDQQPQSSNNNTNGDKESNNTASNGDGDYKYADNQQPQAAGKYQRRTNRDRNYPIDKQRRFRRPNYNNNNYNGSKQAGDDKHSTGNRNPLERNSSNNIINDDSTTQAAEPSSEDRLDGDDNRDADGKERVRVYRRKKPHFNRRGGAYRRNQHPRSRADSSERNSNDTSPQNEPDEDFDSYNHHQRRQNQARTKRNMATRRGYNNGTSRKTTTTYAELSESELNEVVQALKRDFFAESTGSTRKILQDIKETMNNKGPKVVYEFVTSILDHALCDVTSPTKLSKIANRFYQLLVINNDELSSESVHNFVDFQQGFFEALTNIATREDDIAIDAPRYMDTLGQILAECIVPLNTNKCKHLIKSFLNKCLTSYNQQNRAVLLASIMKSMASSKTDRFAKEVWDLAELNWKNVLSDKQTVDLDEFLESHDVKFTTRAFSPRPQRSNSKETSKELEKFADDVTNLVEKQCTAQTLEDMMNDLDVTGEEKFEYPGTLIYAIVRGCLLVDSGSYRLNNEALSKYSSILTKKNEDQEAIALHALTALTKLWHSYNCPQDLLRTILLALHNFGTAPYQSLETWLNSENLNNIPGIGAARLNSKRYIEDLGASLKQQQQPQQS